MWTHILYNYKESIKCDYLLIYWMHPIKISDQFVFKANRTERGRYLTKMLKNVPCLVLQIFLYLEAFESNNTPDWLIHTV